MGLEAAEAPQRPERLIERTATLPAGGKAFLGLVEETARRAGGVPGAWALALVAEVRHGRAALEHIAAGGCTKHWDHLPFRVTCLDARDRARAGQYGTQGRHRELLAEGAWMCPACVATEALGRQAR